VLGHSKTILVLLGGWLFLGDIISGRQFAGMVLAVLGMVGYGVASSQCVLTLRQCRCILRPPQRVVARPCVYS
jgi:hypothetical protein